MIAGVILEHRGNDLASLKEYFDNSGFDINSYVNSIEYGYSVTPQIFSSNTDDGVHQINPDKSFASVGLGASSSSIMSIDDEHRHLYNCLRIRTRSITNTTLSQATGENYNEGRGGTHAERQRDDFMLYSKGLRDHKELEEMVVSSLMLVKSTKLIRLSI